VTLSEKVLIDSPKKTTTPIEA